MQGSHWTHHRLNICFRADLTLMSPRSPELSLGCVIRRALCEHFSEHARIAYVPETCKSFIFCQQLCFVKFLYYWIFYVRVPGQISLYCKNNNDILSLGLFEMYNKSLLSIHSPDGSTIQLGIPIWICIKLGIPTQVWYSTWNSNDHHSQGFFSLNPKVILLFKAEWSLIFRSVKCTMLALPN